MHCNNCSGEIGNQARFCKHCGTKTTTVPPGFSLDNDSGIFYHIERTGEEQPTWTISAYNPADNCQYAVFPPPMEDDEMLSKGYQYDQEENAFFHTLRLVDAQSGPGVLICWTDGTPERTGQEFIPSENQESSTPAEIVQEETQQIFDSPPASQGRFTPLPERRLLKAPPPPPFPQNAILLEDGRPYPSPQVSSKKPR